MNGLKIFLKIIGAGMTAFAGLCLLFIGYHVPLIIQTKDGPTDYVSEPHFYYSCPTEGWGYGRMNNEGLQNLQDYHGQRVDTLVMGSSQMEALSVPQTKATVSLLNRLSNGNQFFYNIGKGAHALPTVVKNLETAINRYHPQKYLVIEIGGVQYDRATLEDTLNCKIKSLFPESNITGFRAAFRTTFLKDLPYVRILMYQLGQYQKQALSQPQKKETVNQEYEQTLDQVMRYISETCAASGVKPLIFYHPRLQLNKDGSASPKTDAAYLAAFRATCEANNVAFLDMTAAFCEAYQNERVLPYGFANSAVGAGHLNKHGHRLIARELYKFITQGGSV